MPTAPMDTLREYVRAATVVYRKGEVIKEEHLGAVTVITIDAFPALPEGATTTVDCHFVHVGFTEALASMSHQEFYDLVISATEGDFASMNLEDWYTGPSYIRIGAWIGDQTDAFRFMATCAAHGLGEVVTPERLRIPQAMRDQAAGVGYVLLSGLTNPREVAAPTEVPSGG